MRFHRNISADLKKLLSAQLQQYENTMVMSHEERKEVRHWVMAGNSPYDNGWYLYDEDGCLLDVVTALRIVEDEAAMKEATYAYDTTSDEPMILISANSNIATTEKLPF